ncbi:AAA family ATPase [Brucella sp. JSBI001]|jgi:SpoVK/Ycf46/Vps4 family AAA+-type ATPase|uniref:AAA family ATPase n=1 Tax=Brucella sp. JSBI001 TaxID=2886044 RepID=UPI00223128FF|nr:MULTISPECIES: ATP-binding protein [Brucella]UZD69316.1 ATP-binding protein [Brucella sp. JSBI001]
MASAQQLIGLVKSHAEGDEDRFFDLAMQLAAAEEQKGHTRLAEQLRQWAEAGKPAGGKLPVKPTPISAPRGPLADLLFASYPSVRLGNVVLTEDTSAELAQIVLEFRRREQLEKNGLRPRQRFLFAGPPGTGKTLSASALAGELKFPLFTVQLHGLISKFMGETAQKLHSVFDAIRTNRGVYLFDEIDALASSRGNPNDVGEARRVLNSFLQFLDDDIGPSIIVATTNHAGLLDPAILRRFDLVLEYQLPEPELIVHSIRQRLANFTFATIDWHRVAKRADGLSHADVISAAEDAARRFVLGEENAISEELLVGAIDRRRSLQQVGAISGGTGQTTLYSEQDRSVEKIQAKRGRVGKTSK